MCSTWLHIGDESCQLAVIAWHILSTHKRWVRGVAKKDDPARRVDPVIYAVASLPLCTDEVLSQPERLLNSAARE